MTKPKLRDYRGQGITLSPVNRQYPKVVLTDNELKSILSLAETEFNWNHNYIQEYPYLDGAIAKLEKFEAK